MLNHPTSDGAFWANPIGAGAAALGFDAVEAWNGRWQQRANTVPFSYSDNYKAVPWYESNFLAHRQLGITGGSDNHWRSVTAVAGAGQPTTWVYARDRTPQAVIEAVRNGRTFVSAEPPLHLGPRLFLTATEDWRGGRRAMVGDQVAPLGRLAVTLKVENGTGQRVRLISTGQVVKELLVVSPTGDPDGAGRAPARRLAAGRTAGRPRLPRHGRDESDLHRIERRAGRRRADHGAAGHLHVTADHAAGPAHPRLLLSRRPTP